MQVILQQDIHNLGKTGEVVKVRPGFARNYLLPKALASAATLKNVNRLEHEKKAAASRNAKAKAEMTELATKVNGIAISLTRKAGEGGKLFGAVTNKEIETALAEKGVEIDRRKIHLAEPIKTVGEFEIPVKLGYDVTATVKVTVVAK
ncbi:MAG: 50S ribosomal protein L9 [Polyangiales bacterium]